MRLIDADDFLKTSIENKRFVFQKEDLLNEQIVVQTVYSDLEKALNTAPTIDAVEVVRCFDCEYGFDWDRDEPYDEVYCAGYCNLREADEVIVQVYSCDYCSYGKRRNDG